MNRIISTIFNFWELTFSIILLALNHAILKSGIAGMLFNKRFSKRSIGLLLALFGVINISFSKEIVPVNFRIATTSTSTVTIGQPSATGTLNITPPTGAFTDIAINDILTFGYDQNSPIYLATGTDVKIKVIVQQWDVNNNTLGTFSKMLSVKYHPNDTTQYQDKSIYLFHNAYKYQLSIDSIFVNGVSKTDLPQNFFLEMEIAGQRYCDFSTTSSTQIPFTLDTLDLDCDNIMDQILVSWSPISGAEQYQLEWTFINDYGTTLTGFLSPSNVYYDFRNNATRISTVNTYYNVSNIFEHGYVLFRLRAIGNDLTNGSLITGVWNTTLDNGPVSGYSSNIHIVLEHEVNKNWQITSSFAEEGKKKEVVSYFDGSLRNRQTVTQMSSDSTTLVGQTIYDYQGRAAVTVLPSPVTPSCSTAVESSIKYYPKFNRSGWHSYNEYSRSDFDSLSSGNTCVSPTDSMSSLSGTSNYYSPRNPNQKGFQAYLPDAKDFPFSQVEYTPDNTGRIRRQSGVGPMHQLGSDHETKYFYGQPNQLELDRMFASEVGDAAHYKKNLVIDANGQTSITYINLEGKTIATALAGDTSLYTISINSGRQKPDTLTVDLFAKDANGGSNLNTINIQQNGIEFNTQLLVGYTSNYKFDYTLSIDTLDDPCLDSNICFNCVYDLNIELLDECGHNYALDSNSHIINKHVGKFSINDTTGNLQFNVACSGGSLYTHEENFTALLTPGNYSLIKRLTVNNDALNFYVNAYLDTLNNKCFKSLNYFQQQALASVDTMNCYITCDACVSSLGSRDSFVAAGKGTALKYDFLYKQCTDPCKPVSPCETSFQMMLADMSPTGQYGQYDSSNFSANAYPLSVFNDSTSKLPNTGTIAHNWHYPQITLNGNTYNHYVNEYGDISTVGITLDTSGKYYPTVMDTTLIFPDTTGGFYTFPENLLNLKDFIANWQPEWANSLVQYHPEYCYYKICTQYETPDSSQDVYTSEGFDQLLQRTNTFHDAASILLVNAAHTGITDWSTFSSGPMSHPYDPVLVYNSHYNGIGGELLTKVSNFQTANSTSYSMIEMASYTARCGSLIGVAPTPNCFAFGTDFNSSSPTDPINDTIRNKEWRLLKNFYFSTKQQLVNKRYDSLTIHDCPAYNACIGDLGFDKSSNNFYNIPSGYQNANQPCGSSTYALYAGKNKRFLTTTESSSMPSSANQAAAQLYTYNHQCPITTSFQNFLSALAAEDSLTKSFSLLHTDAYASLYLATQGAFDPTPPTVYPPITDSYYKWVVLDTGITGGTTAQANTMHVQLVNPVTNYSCSLTIDKTGAGVYWKEIKGFDSLFPSSSNPAVTQTFNLQAKLSYTNSIGGDSSVYKHITGTLGNCFNIVSCNFNTSSSPTTFASDLNLLMTSLANNHDLTNNNVHLEIPLYTPLLTPTIRNEAGTPNTNLYWNYDNTQNVFTLYDASNPLCNLNIAIQTPYPTLTQLQSITSFQDIGSYNNSTSSSQINGYDVNNNLVASLIITATHSCGGNTTGVPMNSNLPPVPVTCNGSQYQATNQLVPLIEDLLINQFVPDSTISIVGSPYFTPLLQGYFPNASSASFTYNSYHDLHAVGSGDEHVFINEQFDSLKISMPGCDLDLFTHPHPDSQFSLQHLFNINAFGYMGLTLTGPVDANGNYHAFYMPVVYAVESVNNTAGCVSDTTIKYLNDTIFGTTCLPLQICNTVCNNGVTASNGLIQYNNGAGLCSDSTPVSPPDVFPPPPPTPDGCVQQLLQAANAAAQNAYDQYVDSLTTYIATKYLNHCLHPLENFYERYLDKQYHYTLYYYDQAGNLVKTIPPEGVNLLGIDSSGDVLEKKIISDRTSTSKKQTVFTAHVLQTNYEYNSLNQLTRQYMPDHDKMDVFETTLPNGLNSQLVVTGSQFIRSSKGYLSGYVDIGSGLKRGYNYVSNDGGQTWLRLTGLVASDLHKVQMVDADRGYAVGNEGTIVRTVDGGQNWDMLNTFSTNITSQFTGLFFTDSLHGVFIGDKQNIIATTDGGLTFSSSITATPPFISTDSLTSVTHDGSSYILTLLRRGGTGIPDYSSIYSSANGTTWTQDSVNTGDLHDVCIYNNPSGNPEAYAVGDNGVLLHKNYGDNGWYMVPASVANAFRYVYFINVNEGIALIDSVPGYAQIYRTSNAGISWTRLSNKGEYYNQITPYEVTTSGAKLIGVGKKGLVSRIIVYHNTPFGVITLNFPDHTKNLTACWATDFTSGSQVPVWALVGDDAGLLFYTYNASNPTVSWNNNLPITSSSIITYTNSSNPSATSITSGIKQIEAIQDTVTSPGHGRVISAQILTADGSVYYLFKPYNSVTSFSTNLVSPTSVTFDRMTFDPINRVVYAYSNSTQKLDTATLKTGNYTNHLSSFMSATADMTNINAITYNSNKTVIAVGNAGIIKYLDLHPSTPYWFDQTNKIIPLQLNAVAYNAYTPKKAYAVGNNGLLLKRYATKQWKILGNGFAKQLNTIGFTSAATGLIAGNQGKLYEYTIVAGTDTTVTTAPVTITTNSNLHEIALNGTQAYISGENGTLLYTNNLLTTGTVFSIIPTTLTSKLNSVSFIPSSGGNAIAVGDRSTVNLLAGTTRVNIKNVFTPALRSINSADGVELYTVGDNYTIRHSVDGGISWSVLLPTSGNVSGFDFTKVKVKSTGTAYVIGNNSYFGKTTASNFITPITLNGSSNIVGGTGFGSGSGVTLNDICINSNGILYMVGEDGSSGISVYYTESTGKWAYLAAAGSLASPLKAMWLFNNNAMMTCGASGYVGYFMGNMPTGNSSSSFTTGVAFAPATYSLTTFNAIYFHDDYTGYLAGNGVLLKSENTAVNLTTYLISGINWQPLDILDSLQGQTNTDSIQINTLTFSSRYYGFMGGSYHNNIQPTVQIGYARVVHDESFYFSTRFWYDRLGRLTLSQNTKQFNKQPKALSYTTYDALGRITEVGELAMNNHTYNLNSVFGDYINDYYNPLVINDTSLNSFITHNLRTEVTHTYYDTLAIDSLPTNFVQNNLRKRVSSVTYEDVYDNNPQTFNHATHYSYDVHGSVTSLLQDNPTLSSIRQRFKRTDYDYDLISGKVNDVQYQHDSTDAFSHHYEYDADNRITHVYTSRFPQAQWAGYKDAFWDNDANYYYYKHGPLARTEIGDNQLQGMDYAYTIQGWMKGVNSDILQPNNDMGKDGFSKNSNHNKNFARDAYGYSLTYFNGDYAAIGNNWKTDSLNRFTASQYGSTGTTDVNGNRYNLYNGNIGSMVTSISNPTDKVSMPQASSYKYDQLNRIIEARSFQDLTSSANTWKKEGLINTWEKSAYYNSFSYDANGNILGQYRTDATGNGIDSLIYNYAHDSNHELFQNRLYSVNDKVAANKFSDDIDDQGIFDTIIERVNVGNNYSYDEIGQLKKDSAEQIQSITWTVYGKIKTINRYTGSMKQNLGFDYDAAGNRIAKHVYTSAGVWQKSTYYVRDAQGNVMGTYEKKSIGSSLSYRIKEHDVYGNSRMGVSIDSLQLIGANPDTINYTRILGQKEYEMSNHLGNVVTVINDRKIAQAPTQVLSIYSNPVLARIGIDSLGGMKIQPLTQNGGNIFAVKTIVGQSYQADFYINLANTVSGDALSLDYPLSTGNSLASTGHYTYNFTATDTLSNLITYYASTGNTPNDYFLFDSLNVINTSITNDTIRGYRSGVASVSDYYPFGSIMSGRQYAAQSQYRYGMNGKEKDDEVDGGGNTYNYGFRIYDARLGRFLSVDPLTKGYPWYTPYQFAGNKPIVAIDLDGLEEYIIHNIYNKKTGDLESISVASFKDVAGNARENNIHKDGNDITNKKVMTTYSYNDGTPMSEPTFQDELTKTQKSIEAENTKVSSVGPSPSKSQFNFDGYEGDKFSDGTFNFSKRLFEPTPTFGGKKVVPGAKFMQGGIPAFLGVGSFPQAGEVHDILGQIPGLSNAIKKAGGITEVNITLTGRPGTGLSNDQLNEYTNQLHTAAGNIQKAYQKQLGKGVKVNVNSVVDPNNSKASETTIKLK
jgi:RHS repeat-associated protein